MGATATLERVRFSDVSGQKRMDARDIPLDATVGELIRDVSAGMRLGERDVEGRPLAYAARLEREGRHLYASELCGEVLRNEDEITLQPSIDAGAPESPSP